jgi:hypothetical protein
MCKLISLIKGWFKKKKPPEDNALPTMPDQKHAEKEQPIYVGPRYPFNIFGSHDD